MASPKQAKAKPEPYPFLFLQHGPWAASDYCECAEWQVVFRGTVPENERKRILDSVFPPLDDSGWSGDRVLTLSTGQDAGVGIWNAYSGQPLSDEAMQEGDFENVNVTTAHIKTFCANVDEWLFEVHQAHPIALVIGSTDKKDKWHKWSVKQFPNQLLPMFEELFRSARPATEVPKDPISLEASMAYATVEAVLQYFSSHELADADANLVARIKSLMDSINGYSDLADAQIWYVRKCIQEERQSP